MAQLKDSLITGDLRVTGTIYGDANLSSLNASGTGLGTNGQILTSTGTGLAWSNNVAPSSHTHAASDITSGTLGVARGGTGLSASPSMLTDLSSTTAANVLQASPRPGITGTLGLGNGGTGATTAANAVNNLLSGAPNWTAVPTDSTYFIRQDTGGSNSFGKAPFSTVWTYIKGKADSVYAASDHNHDSAYVNVTGDTMSGSLAVSNTANDTAGLSARIKTKTYEFGLHMGTGGVNHGLYDWIGSKWVVLGDASNNWQFKGKADSATGFASAKSIALTGNVTGSATGGNDSNGWSITTTIGSGVVTNAMLAGSIANGKLVNSKVTIAGNDVSLGGSLAAATLKTSLGLNSAMHYIGKATVAITDGSTTDPKIGGNATTLATGDVVIDSSDSREYVWNGSKWELLGGDSSYKVTQTAVTDTAYSGSDTATTFVSAVTQNANGEITVTKRKLPTYNNYSHPTGDGNKHVPANGTSNNGKFLQATGTAGTYQWAALPTASTGAAGIIQIGTGASNAAAGNHTHDDRYYTETEVDTKLKKYVPSFVNYRNTSGNNNGKYYKIAINSYVGWMINFTIKLYHAYRAYDIQISGYNYGSNYWYSPEAVLLGTTQTDSISVIFGYDSTYHLWVAIPANQYTGISICGVTNGYTEITDFEDLFTITMVDAEPTTKQTTITARKPLYTDEMGTLATKSSISNHSVTTPTGATSRTQDVTLNTTTVNSITGVGTLPSLTVTATDVVTGGTTTDIPNITKKTVVTGVTKKTVVTGGSTTDVPNITKKTVVTSATAAKATYANGVLTISDGSVTTGDSVTVGTAIKAYTSLTTGDSVTVTTGDSVTVGTAIKAYTALTTSSIGSASGWSAGTLPTKGSNTTVATGINKQPTFTVTTQTTTLTHTIS